MSNILKSIVEGFSEVVSSYGLQDEETYKNINTERLRELIKFSSVVIKIPSKDNSSYIDVYGRCSWDEEHGLEVLVHKDRVIHWGDIAGDTYWKAVTDNGTYNDIVNKVEERPIPRKYQPHPKYNKLKPSQQAANDSFEYSLISGNHNGIFKELVEKGEIDINGKYESQNKTFLESACWFKNNSLVEYLLSKGSNIRFAIHECLGYNYNPQGLELILKYGGNINQQNLTGETILRLEVNKLVGLYDGLLQSEKYGWNKKDFYIEKIGKQKELINFLIGKGCDPKISNKYGHDCYSKTRNLSEDFRNEIIIFLDQCIKKHRRRWWKFWK
ncbi:MAG: hypothetical protein K2X86_12505 [Cytophagaceae bacterium]|nr:hypothetical protein [Cytophagaceae bacterium]